VSVLLSSAEPEYQAVTPQLTLLRKKEEG